MAENENQEKVPEERIIDLKNISDEDFTDFAREKTIELLFGKKPKTPVKIVGADEISKEREEHLGELIGEEYCWILFRQASMEQIARHQGETLRCPQCHTLVPSTMMTWFQKDIGGGFYEPWRFCTICETEFNPVKKEEKKEEKR